MPTLVTPTLRVVPIAEANLEEVAPLVNRAFATYKIFEGIRTSPQDYADEAGEEARVILIEQEGRLVASGMIARAERFIETDQLGPAGTERPGVTTTLPPEHPWSGALYFGLAGVEPEIMNQGLGRMLVGKVEEIARAEGYPRVGLGTLREFGLVAYYEKLSYRTFHTELHPAGHWNIVVEHLYCEMVKDL
jgi:GNAT superfamily N-acetyltransferase